MCMACKSRELYRESEERRKYFDRVNREWVKKHPERAKKLVKKAGLKYYKKNKERILEERRLFSATAEGKKINSFNASIQYWKNKDSLKAEKLREELKQFKNKN